MIRQRKKRQHSSLVVKGANEAAEACAPRQAQVSAARMRQLQTSPPLGLK